MKTAWLEFVRNEKEKEGVGAYHFLLNVPFPLANPPTLLYTPYPNSYPADSRTPRVADVTASYFNEYTAETRYKQLSSTFCQGVLCVGDRDAGPPSYKSFQFVMSCLIRI